MDYQGDASFLKKDLLDTVKELLKLQKQYRSAENLSRSTMDVEGDATETPKVGKFDQSTDTIANLLGAKTGPDLVLAAAAHLHFVKKNKRSLLGK